MGRAAVDLVRDAEDIVPEIGVEQGVVSFLIQLVYAFGGDLDVVGGLVDEAVLFESAEMVAEFLFVKVVEVLEHRLDIHMPAEVRGESFVDGDEEFAMEFLVRDTHYLPETVDRERSFSLLRTSLPWSLG